MNEFVQVIAIVFMFSIIMIETMLYIQDQKDFNSVVLFSVLIGLIFGLYLYFGEASDVGRSINPVLLAINNIIVVTISVTFFLVSNKKIISINKKWLKHISAVTTAFIFSLCLPWLALLTSCYTGLDCL